MIATLADGLQLAHDDAGSGVALLFVHGWPHDRTLWRGQVSGLATHARCIAPDLRGCGGSGLVGPYTIDQYADDLAALLDELAIPLAIVCGLSMGGYIAFAMCRRHRARVRGLVLTGTRATADSPEQREGRERIVAFAEQCGMSALAEQQLPRMTGPETRSSRPELCDALVRMMAAAPAEGAIAAQRAMIARADSTATLGAIDVPTLVVAGMDDAIIPVDEQRAMAMAIPGALFRTIDGAGHVAPYERPGVFNHMVAEFLDGSLVVS